MEGYKKGTRQTMKTQIQFSQDLESLAIEESPKTTAWVLMGFFKFYDEKFDPNKYFINVSFQGKPFPKRSELISFFDKSFIF